MTQGGALCPCPNQHNGICHIPNTADLKLSSYNTMGSLISNGFNIQPATFQIECQKITLRHRARKVHLIQDRLRVVNK